MFKRFTCMILSLVLLVGLIPAMAIQASAAANETSSDAITILKKLETFVDHCDKDGLTGYGTVCTETGNHGVTTATRHNDSIKGTCNAEGYFSDGTRCNESGPHGPVHTIRENEASAELEKALETIDTAINNFASSKGIALTQNQHDALALFSFENGTGWMSGTDDLQSAVVNGLVRYDFWNVMENWKSNDDDARRRVETNMYLFDSYVSYISNADLEKKLANSANKDEAEDLVNDLRVKVTVTNAYINVRDKASLYGTKVGTVYQGDVLRVTETVQAEGYLWGFFIDENYDPVGYVALMYTNYDQVIADDEAANENTESGTKRIGTAEVSVNGYVNVRSGPGTKNPIVSSLRDGTEVDLYEIQYVNGQRWGKINVGWFSLAYATDIDIFDDENVIYNDYNHVNYKFYDYRGRRISDADIFEKNASGEFDEVAVDEDTSVFTTLVEVTLRETPAPNGLRLDTISKGTEFDVDRVKADDNTLWGRTTLGSKVGWIDLSTQYVKRNGVELEDETDSDEVVTLATAKLDVNIRNKADIYGTKVGTLPAGTIVEVLDGPENGTRMTGWYLLKFDNSSGTDSWARGDNLDIREGTRSEITYGKTPTSPSGTQAATGRGMVANTYGGVNVRTAPGTANAKVTKLLPGTVVDILSVTYYGSTKWGQIAQGWVCMDYIAMMDYDDLPTSSGSTSSSAVVTTSAIFEATAKVDEVKVYKKADRNSDVVRELDAGESVTIHELLTSTEVVSEAGSTKVTQTVYWARVNDGYVCDIVKDRNELGRVLAVDTLYEETFTVTETEMLKVRNGAGTAHDREDLDLNKGDQVTVTNVEIVDAQYWGEIEHDDLSGGKGWICLNYCTRGAVSVGGGNEGSGDENSGESGNGGSAVVPTTMSMGNTGVGTYAGKVTGSAQVQEVNVRKEPTTSSAEVTTLKKGTAITITETRLVDGRSWGYCGSGWINLLYVDLTPVGVNAIDAKIIAVDNTLVYESSETGARVVGSYANRAVVHIYSEMNGMYETDMGWISKGNCL